MKPAPLILAATLLINAALLAVIIIKQPATPANPPRANTPQSELRTPHSSSTPDPRTLAELFASDDTPALIRRLREMNLPADIIRSVASARLDKDFAARREALEDPPSPYWNRYSRLSQIKPDPASRARRTERLALEKEYQAALRELTAELPDAERSAYERRRFGNLSDAKVAQLEIVLNDYRDLRGQISDETSGVTISDDQSQFDLLDKEQRADLEKILTPAELREYELRSSSLARNLQQQIRNFNATEAEYIALYDAQATVNEQTAGAKLSEAELKLLQEAAAQAVLSTERFEEYKITTTETYSDVRNLVNSLKLPKTAIAEIITIQNEITAQADRIRNDPSLEPTERNAQLAALAQNAEQQLHATFSGKANGLKRYQSGATGKWLRQISPRQSKKSK